MQRIDFKSDEEWFFYNWLLEAEKKNLIYGIIYQPKPFLLSNRAVCQYEKKLKTKTKLVEKFLFAKHSYTPDFCFRVRGPLKNSFIHSKFLEHDVAIVDVKGIFNKYGDPKQFSINQKWMYAKYGLYVEKIVPEKLFKKTWCPDICRYTPKKRQPVKKYINIPNVDQFLQGEL